MSQMLQNFPTKNLKRPPSSGGFYNYPVASRSLNPLPQIAPSPEKTKPESRTHMMVFTPAEPPELLADRLRAQLAESNNTAYHGFNPKESREVTLMRPLGLSRQESEKAAEAFEALPDSRAASPCSSPYGAGQSSVPRRPALVSSFPPNDFMTKSSPSGRTQVIKLSGESASTQTEPYYAKQKFEGMDEYTDWSSDVVDPLLRELRLAVLSYKPIDVVGFSRNWLQEKTIEDEQNARKKANKDPNPNVWATK